MTRTWTVIGVFLLGVANGSCAPHPRAWPRLRPSADPALPALYGWAECPGRYSHSLAPAAPRWWAYSSEAYGGSFVGGLQYDCAGKPMCFSMFHSRHSVGIGGSDDYVDFGDGTTELEVVRGTSESIEVRSTVGAVFTMTVAAPGCGT